ncbi:MAG: hypothetical protein ACLU3I_08635 [Acutalibacteraceae bacterium]
MEDGFNYQTAIEEFQDARDHSLETDMGCNYNRIQHHRQKRTGLEQPFSFVLALIPTIIIALIQKKLFYFGWKNLRHSLGCC